MLTFDLATVDEAFLERVCAERWPESSTLDFKRDVPGIAEPGKTEFLKDVAAMANTDGGDLIYGIAENDGLADAVQPIVGQSFDALKLRLAQSLDSLVEPRINGITFNQVPVKNGYVLLVRIPPSFETPHAIRIHNNKRFVMRNSGGVYDLTMGQLRESFGRTASLVERAEKMQEDRLTALMSNKGAMVMETTHGVAALHLLPLSGFANRVSLDLKTVIKLHPRLIGSDWGGGSASLNLDGVLIYPGQKNKPVSGYRQLFRNGCLEAAEVVAGSRNNGSGVEFIVYPRSLADFYHENLTRYLSLAKDLQISGPAILGMSLLDVRGYQIPMRAFLGRNPPASDRDYLMLRNIFIEDLATADYRLILPQAMDVMYQAFTLLRCPGFNADTGEYEPQNFL
ncbi:MAG: ATP-binding protein [Polaromonas sp.]|nr:ATP-binding protein [Polaromonas sp.]